VIKRLFYTSNPERLVFSDIATYVLDPASGTHVADLSGERLAVLSIDGTTLMTFSNFAIVLRNVSDWKQQRMLPRLTPYEWPVFMDAARGLHFLEMERTPTYSLLARLSDGQMPPDVKLAKFPKTTALYETPAFAAIDPHSGFDFGHSGDRLWASDLKTGQTCESPDLFSASGEMSVDGSLLAGQLVSGI